MKREECLEAIETLNKHYSKNVNCQRKSERNSPSPYFDVTSKSIFLPSWRGFYKLQIIAHEYAHAICRLKATNYLSMHDVEFEAAYCECCLVLGVFAIPTYNLVNEIIKNWNNEHPDKMITFKYPS